MNEEKAKSYVYYYCENYISLSTIKSMKFFFAFITYILLVCWIVSDTMRWYSILSILFTVFYFVAIPFFAKSMKKHDSFPLRFLVNGVFASLTELLLLAILYMLLPVLSESIVLKLMIIPLVIVFNLSYTGITVLQVKRSRYLNKKRNYASGAISGGIAATFGYAILRVMSYILDEDTEKIFFFVILFLMVLLVSLGTLNFLKYYWCKKYGITCDESGEASSPMLYTDTYYVKKRSLPAKIALTFAKTIVIVFAVLILVGVYVQNKV